MMFNGIDISKLTAGNLQAGSVASSDTGSNRSSMVGSAVQVREFTDSLDNLCDIPLDGWVCLDTEWIIT